MWERCRLDHSPKGNHLYFSAPNPSALRRKASPLLEKEKIVHCLSVYRSLLSTLFLLLLLLLELLVPYFYNSTFLYTLIQTSCYQNLTLSDFSQLPDSQGRFILGCDDFGSFYVPDLHFLHFCIIYAPLDTWRRRRPYTCPFCNLMLRILLQCLPRLPTP